MDLAPRVSTGGASPSPVRQVRRSRRHHLAAPGHHTAVTVSVTAGHAGHVATPGNAMAVAGWPGGRLTRVATWPRSGPWVASEVATRSGQVAMSAAGGHAGVPRPPTRRLRRPARRSGGHHRRACHGRGHDGGHTTWPPPCRQSCPRPPAAGWPGELATDCPAGRLVCRRGGRRPAHAGGRRLPGPFSAKRRRGPFPRRTTNALVSPAASSTSWWVVVAATLGGLRTRHRSADRGTGACRSPPRRMPRPRSHQRPRRCGAKGRQCPARWPPCSGHPGRGGGGHRARRWPPDGHRRSGHRHGRWPLASPGHRGAPVHRARVATRAGWPPAGWPWPPPTWPRGPAPLANRIQSEFRPPRGTDAHDRQRQNSVERAPSRAEVGHHGPSRTGGRGPVRGRPHRGGTPLGTPAPAGPPPRPAADSALRSNHRPTGEGQLPGRTAGRRGDVHRRGETHVR